MKKLLLLLILLPLLAFGKKAEKYDWFLVQNGFKGEGWIDAFTAYYHEKIYVYNAKKDGVCDIYLFDKNGKVKGWYWVSKGLDKIENTLLYIH